MQLAKTTAIALLTVGGFTAALEACGGGDGATGGDGGSGGAASSRGSHGTGSESASSGRGTGGRHASSGTDMSNGGGSGVGGSGVGGSGVGGSSAVGGSNAGGSGEASSAASSSATGPSGFCGDGTCNDGETQASCCKDCGCPNNQTCQNGSCVANPFCGDGTCGSGESQSNCCKDCGCPSGETCENNQCSCSQATLHFENVMPNNANFCISLNEEYTQYSAAYLTLGAQNWYLPYQGWVDDTENLGTTDSATVQCCYLDGCVGNESCPTTTGPAPCICNAPYHVSIPINTCGSTLVSLCN